MRTYSFYKVIVEKSTHKLFVENNVATGPGGPLYPLFGKKDYGKK